MTSYSSTLTRKGQATIPVELREELGMREGDKLIWTYADGSLSVTTAREIVRRTAGIFKGSVPERLEDASLAVRLALEKEAAAQGWTERWERFVDENGE